MKKNEIKITNFIDASIDEMVKDVQLLVSKNTVYDKNTVTKDMPRGKNVAEGFVMVKEYLGNRGIPNWYFSDKYRNFGHFVVNKGHEQNVLFVIHIDTVPYANEEKWVGNDALSGKIVNDCIYGRGSLDDKGALVSAVWAIKALTSLNIKIPFELRGLIGGDEETLCKCPIFYLENNPTTILGLVLDGGFPMVYGEKSIYDYEIKIKQTDNLIESISATNINNIVPDFCKAVININYDAIKKEFDFFLLENNTTGKLVKISEKQSEILINGMAAHGMDPSKGVNAITLLFVFLSRFDFGNRICLFIEKHLHNNFHGNLFNISGFDSKIKEGTIINFGAIKKEGEYFYLTLNIRFLNYKITSEIIINQISIFLEKLFENNFSIKVINSSDGFKTDLKKPLWQFVNKTYKEVLDDPNSKPIFSSGGTYAKYINNAVCLGPLTTKFTYKAHCINENLPIESLIEATKFYAILLYRLISEKKLL